MIDRQATPADLSTTFPSTAVGCVGRGVKSHGKEAGVTVVWFRGKNRCDIRLLPKRDALS